MCTNVHGAEVCESYGKQKLAPTNISVRNANDTKRRISRDCFLNFDVYLPPVKAFRALIETIHADNERLNQEQPKAQVFRDKET